MKYMLRTPNDKSYDIFAYVQCIMFDLYGKY